LADDFRLHGRQAIEKVRKTQPAAYLKICALLVPREFKVEQTAGIKGLTDEELERMLEALRAMVAKPVIEAEADPLLAGDMPASATPRTAS
jgi:hypothetical protein